MEKLRAPQSIRNIAINGVMSGLFLVGAGCSAAENPTSVATTSHETPSSTSPDSSRFCLEKGLGIRPLQEGENCPSNPQNKDAWTIYERDGEFCVATGPTDVTIEIITSQTPCPPESLTP
jgi:hypothetical protein